MATLRKRTGQYHHGDLRTALMAAAWRVIKRQGLEGLSLRAVAEALGVSHAAPAHHFASKEALLLALRADAWGRFAEALEATADLDQAGRAYVRFATEHPRQLELMFRRHGPTPEAKRAWSALVARVAQAIGPKRAADARELDAMTLVAWAQVQGLAALLTEAPLPGGFPAERLLDRVHEAFAAALTRR